MLSRREFLISGAALPFAVSAAQRSTVRVAIVTTVYHYLSHAQHFGDRFLIGYPYAGAWHRPDIKVVSLYVDQKPDADLSESRAKEFGFKVYRTIGEALCCGTDKLACDAVLMIGEHGNYPVNEKGQQLYPRYEFFQKCVEVFRASGRAVPVYNDKSLSYSFEKAREMVDISKKLGFPMLGGSSLPVTFRLPDIDVPLGAEVEDAVMVGWGSPDAMDFHGLECLQCMVERRRGGETGVKAVQLLTGDAVWKALKKGQISSDLLTSALSRCDSPLGLSEKDGRVQDMVRDGVLPGLVGNPTAHLIEYRDGLRAALLMLNGGIKDFAFAAQVKGVGTVSTQFFLTPLPNVTYSACLVQKIEQMFMSGRAPYPIERTLLTGGILESGFDSKVNGSKRLETPALAVSYQAPAESQHCRV